MGLDDIDRKNMWQAVLRKVDEIKDSYLPDLLGSHREQALYTADGNGVYTLADFEMPDGSHEVYYVKAYHAFHHSLGHYDITVKKYYHNAEDYWETLINEFDEKPHQRVIVNNEHYTIGSEDALGPRGFGGYKWKIKFFDGHYVESTNLWHQGVIPPVFRDRLPNNAEFIKNEFNVDNVRID